MGAKPFFRQGKTLTIRSHETIRGRKKTATGQDKSEIDNENKGFPGDLGQFHDGKLS